MDSKICKRCLQPKELTEFYAHKTYGYQTWCKDCKKEYEKDYSKRPEAIESQRRTYERLRDSGYFRRYYSRGKQDAISGIKKAVWRYILRRKQQGEIEQQPCLKCGKQNAEAHHSDYKQPLLIVWLCHSCHMGLHNSIKVKERECKR